MATINYTHPNRISIAQVRYEAWLAAYKAQHHTSLGPCTWVTGGITAQGSVRLLPFQSVTLKRRSA